MYDTIHRWIVKVYAIAHQSSRGMKISMKLRTSQPSPTVRLPRLSTCHPDRTHYGKGLCRSCYAKHWRTHNPEKRYHKPRSREDRQRYAESLRLANHRWKQRHPEQHRAQKRANRVRTRERRRLIRNQWYANNPGAREAHNAVDRAVQTGTLVKPVFCERCGRAGSLHGHHYKGYEYPLTVQWLCPRCHSVTEMASKGRVPKYAD